MFEPLKFDSTNEVEWKRPQSRSIEREEMRINDQTQQRIYNIGRTNKTKLRKPPRNSQ